MEALPSRNQTNRSVELGRVGQPVAQRDQTNPVLSGSQVRGERRLGNSILPGATKRSFVKTRSQTGVWERARSGWTLSQVDVREWTVFALRLLRQLKHG